MLIEDTVFENGVMDNEKVPFGKFAGSLRQKLMQEHLGESKPIKDCISDTFYKDVWLRIASKNSKIFEEIFDCVPSDNVTTLEDNLKDLQKRPLAETEKYLSLQKVKQIQGHLVLLPLNYLKDVNMLPKIGTMESLAPTIMWT